MPTVRLALLATVVAGGSIATGAYFAFRDDVFAGLVGRQTEKQITSEDQITALRAQVYRITSQQSLDKERVEQQRQRHATLEQVTSELAKDLSIQARYGLPASGAIESPPLLSPVEKPSAPIVAIPAESAKQAKQAVIGHKKAHRHHRKHARVVRKRTHKRPTIAAGGYNAYWGGPAGQQN
jgi:type II secretory pathway component PulJ